MSLLECGQSIVDVFIVLCGTSSVIKLRYVDCDWRNP